MQDDMQVFRLQQMDKCFQDHQIPCRWIPDGGYQYGYPQFNFYAPGVYYLGEVIHLLGFQFIDTVKILFILGIILSSVTAFIFFRCLFGNWPAFVGVALYTYAPFRAVEIYVRGSLSEFWSFVFFPLIFWASYQLVKTARLKYLVWLSFSLGFLFLTHNLMSFLFLPLLFLWLFYFLWPSQTWLWQEKKWKNLYQISIALVLGFGLASFFLLPMLLERSFVHLESMIGGYFDFRQHFVTVNELFLSNHFGYGSSVLGPNDDLSLSVGIIQWIGGLLSIFLAVLLRKKFPQQTKLVLLLGATEMIVLFLMHQRSTFIWEKLTLLAWIQFPWRLLALSGFLLSTLSAAAVYLSRQFRGQKTAISLSVVMIFAVYLLQGIFFQPQAWLNITDQDKFSGQSWEKQLTASIFDYLPIYAKLPPNRKASPKPEIISGQAEFINYQKKSDYQKGELIVTKSAKIRLPLFDFPGMKVYVDGKEANFSHDDCRFEDYCFGLISFDLSPGKHIIEARLTDTDVRTIGNLVSFLSLFLLIALLYLYEKKPAQ